MAAILMPDRCGTLTLRFIYVKTDIERIEADRRSAGARRGIPPAYIMTMRVANQLTTRRLSTMTSCGLRICGTLSDGANSQSELARPAGLEPAAPGLEGQIPMS